MSAFGKSSVFALAVLSAMVLFSHAGRADDAAAEAGKKRQIELFERAAADSKRFAFDYGIPASPALTLLDLGTDKIKPATALKPFVLALPGLLDGSGDGAVALDMSPVWLLDPDLTVSDFLEVDESRPNAAFRYDADGAYWKRLLSRTRVGLALYRGDAAGGDVTKAKPSRAAASLSFGLSDGSDPLTAGGSTDLFLTDNDSRTAWSQCVRRHQLDIEPLASTIEQSERATDQSKLLLIADDGSSAASTKAMDEVERNYFARQARLERKDSDEKKVEHVAGGNASERLTELRHLLISQQAPAEALAKGEAQATARKKALTGCDKEASAAAEHGVDLQFGLGIVWSGKPGSWDHFNDHNEAFWLAGRVPLDMLGDRARGPKDCTKDDSRRLWERMASCWMIGGTGRFSHGEIVPTGDTATPAFKASILEGWVGLERVSERMKFGAFFGYSDRRAIHDADKAFSQSGTRWLVSTSISLEGRIPIDYFKGAWLEASYGAAQGSAAPLNDKTFLVSISFAPADTSTD